MKLQLVGRSLFCLGLLIRYGSPLLSNSSYKNIDVMKSLSLLKKYLQTEDLVIRVRALQVSFHLYFFFSWITFFFSIYILRRTQIRYTFCRLWDLFLLRGLNLCWKRMSGKF